MNINLYLDAREVEDICNYCIENFSEEVVETIRIANDVSNNTFKFEWKWDMERTFVPYTFTKDIIWDKTPNNDEEWVFMLNRHRYWITLGQAYVLTKDEKYTKTFIRQLTHWIKNVRQVGEAEKTTWRTIEAGIRGENWVKAYSYFSNSEYINEETTRIFVESLKEHGEYLYNNYCDARKLSNWGVLESHGLLVIGLFLNDKELSEKYVQESLRRLEEQIDLQVMEDGMHWEQSPMYLNEVLHCYLDTINLCKRNNIEIPNIILEKTKKLAYANLYMKKPNHRQICQSDSDDTDLRDMLSKAAYLFEDGILKFGAYEEIDFESIWSLGYDSIKKYKDINVKCPEHVSYGFEDSGNYYMRSGWSENDNYMYFHCGTLGSGHGHADLLHISLFANGEDYLIDPGRYTYIEGNEEREYLKSCKAHNTTIVDDDEFTKINGSWGYSSVATPIKHPFISKDSYDYLEGSHLGYISKGIFTNRSLIYIKPDIWVLVDRFYGEGTHKYNQIFQFAKNVELKNEKTICKGNNGALTLHHINKLDKYIEKKIVSYHYNQMELQDKLITTLKGDGFTSILTVINSSKKESNISIEKIPIKNCNGRILEDNEAEAIKIINKENTYIIAICHNEIFKGKKLLIVDGYHIYGKVVLITKNNEGIKKEIIKY
ncbi:alginate lyase family protein [Romboutsia sp. 1001713B170207_170306_H8]|uniref:alginate lyase family protein n=1 Tax=Romboutsia sp. 1001713B170207_170306_H8 TaxID=2787112 RepID=UPI001899F169|nr:alginate lyase family protein [Romboutsia sp. 1001713B170207_170306_H8]